MAWSTTFWNAPWFRFAVPSSATIVRALTSLRMASELALADVSISSEVEMRLRTFWSEACDQVFFHAGSLNRSAKGPSRKVCMAVAEMLATWGSDCGKPNAATKAASTACLLAGAGV